VLGPSPTRAQEGDPLDAIARVVRTGDVTRARDALRQAPEGLRRTAAVRFLGAVLALRDGDASTALRLAPWPPPRAFPRAARQQLAALRAEALRRAAPPDDALDALRALSASPERDAAIAETLLRAGRLDAAVAALEAAERTAAATVDTVAVRMQLAEAQARGGDREAAATTLRRVLLRRPEHPAATAAAHALADLAGAAVTFTFPERLARAERLHRYRRHRAALRELDLAGDAPDPQAARRVLHLRGMALYRMRGRENYLAAAEALAAAAALGTADEATEDRFHAARALSRADQDARAADAYRALARDRPRHRRSGQARFLAAWLDLQRGADGGARRMREVLEEVPSHARAARWQLALHAFETGDHARAAALFARHARTGEGGEVAGRGRYWEGRAQQARGARGAALRAYRAALRAEPLHWYALLARQRIEELGADPGPPFPDPPERGSAHPRDVTLPADVAFFHRLGLRSEAVAAMREHEARWRRRRGGVRRLVLAYRRVGASARALRLVGGPSTLRRTARPGPADRWRWEAAFPRPYRSAVEAEAARRDLTADHLYAIMRQESGFDPDAVSYADAVGLLQLLPTTAARVARRLGDAEPPARAALFVPATNVRLGAAYVETLVERFGVPWAFAAYNAGSPRVARWRRRGPLDLAVEGITVGQTRDYIRRVTSHYARYLYLAHPERGWPLRLDLAPPTP
jgi:soluble lytic murein transglycosylase